ncbi:hypothetical protein Clacol_000304 [Clathrus columnatus]|uniref:Pre-rRNA-processing protein IPI3 n=1 Tax=Clathrus columnatus TaxID=1419009 RepID=A0AAV5A2J9_9AGAM|nr:hypothetical protein Clacol_000304 [Clathrus columnatus]
MPIQETIFCCLAPTSNTGSGLIALHDIQTGTSLASFKPTNSTTHSVSYIETRPGLGGVILAAQSDKSIINDQLTNKIILGEKLTCLTLDNSGDYCAGGTSNGRIYLWEVASGILFNTFEAHYRRISTLQFTRDGSALISGSDDSSVSVWLMSRLIDEDLQSEIPSSYCTFNEHTLPITDISCGTGAFPSCRVFTSSMDRSVKSERFIFAGSADGSIYQFNLFRKRSGPGEDFTYEAVGGGGMADVIRVDDETDKRTMSGQIHIYDVVSHQLLRSINVYKDKGLSVTCLSTLLRPIDLFGHVSLGESAASAKENDPVRPVAQFHKIKDAHARVVHDVPIMFPRQPSKPYSFTPSLDELLQEHRYYIQSGSGESNGLSLQSRLSELEVEVTKLRDELATAKGLNDDMWENIVQKVLAGDIKTNTNGEIESESGERSKKRSRNV